MSATDQIRAQLAQLMGSSVVENTKHGKIKFDDKAVCKPYLLSCCPHEILQSTKYVIGECPNVHDVGLRADYEAASKSYDYCYEVDAYERLQRIINGCNGRVEHSRMKLRRMEVAEERSPESQALLHKLRELGIQIGSKLARAEQAGLSGNVAESLQLMEEVELLKDEKSKAESKYKSTIPATAFQQQKLIVCEVCSGMLGLHDIERRLADHFGGRMHLGFIKMRERLEELRRIVDGKRDILISRASHFDSGSDKDCQQDGIDNRDRRGEASGNRDRRRRDSSSDSDRRRRDSSSDSDRRRRDSSSDSYSSRDSSSDRSRRRRDSSSDSDRSESDSSSDRDRRKRHRRRRGRSRARRRDRKRKRSRSRSPRKHRKRHRRSSSRSS